MHRRSPKLHSGKSPIAVIRRSLRLHSIISFIIEEELRTDTVPRRTLAKVLM